MKMRVYLAISEKKKKGKKKKAGFTILFSKVILRVLVRAIFLCDH